MGQLTISRLSTSVLHLLPPTGPLRDPYICFKGSSLTWPRQQKSISEEWGFHLVSSPPPPHIHSVWCLQCGAKHCGALATIPHLASGGVMNDLMTVQARIPQRTWSWLIRKEMKGSSGLGTPGNRSWRSGTLG